MMIALKNLFRKSSQSIVKLSLALRALIGTIATAGYIQDKPDLAFWLLVAGAVIDFLLQLLPEDARAKGHKILLIVGLVAAASLLSGCKVLRPATESSLIDSVKTEYKQVPVLVPGAAVNQQINYDSLANVWLFKYKQFQKDSTEAAKAGKPIPARPETPKQTATDPQTKAQLTYWVDQYGKLQVSCESKDQTIQMLVAETNRLRLEAKTETIIVKETPAWNWVAMGSLASLLVAAILIIVFKNLLK